MKTTNVFVIISVAENEEKKTVKNFVVANDLTEATQIFQEAYPDVKIKSINTRLYNVITK